MSLLTVLGFGNVGQTLCKQAINTGLKIIGVGDSSGIVLSKNIKDGLSIDKINELSLLKKNNKQKLIDWNGLNEQIISLSDMSSKLPENSVIADCSSSDYTTKYLISSQKEKNISICLANKKPLTSSLNDFKQLTLNKDLIRFESTVGAGLPVISSLNRLLDSGDKLIKIQGQLSGTIGYILSNLQSPNVLFSDVVKQAKQLGYTEPDPRDDLSGIDIARKALILARCIGIKIDLDDINIDCLYPNNMSEEHLSINEFMDNLYNIDDDMNTKIVNATNNGNRLRYAAVVSNNNISVGLVEVDNNNSLYNLVGTDNLISMETEWYKSPLVISGPGAGVDVTAAGVLSDIFDLKSSELKKKWVLD